MIYWVRCFFYFLLYCYRNVSSSDVAVPVLLQRCLENLLVLLMALVISEVAFLIAGPSPLLPHIER